MKPIDVTEIWVAVNKGKDNPERQGHMIICGPCETICMATCKEQVDSAIIELMPGRADAVKLCDVPHAAPAGELLLADVLGVLKKLEVIEHTSLQPRVKPSHGSCCTCQTCGRGHDDCVCESNEIIAALQGLGNTPPPDTGELSPEKVARMLRKVRGALELERLREALRFYADPETYHAIAVLADRPCGAFADDFSEDHGGDYSRPMPGKMARDVLRSLQPESEADDGE